MIDGQAMEKKLLAMKRARYARRRRRRGRVIVKIKWL